MGGAVPNKSCVPRGRVQSAMDAQVQALSDGQEALAQQGKEIQCLSPFIWFFTPESVTKEKSK